MISFEMSCKNISHFQVSVMVWRHSFLYCMHGRDVFARMPTGSGKSVCMFPGPLALSDSAIGLVVSPLSGLMEQQVSVVLIGCNIVLYCT